MMIKKTFLLILLIFLVSCYDKESKYSIGTMYGRYTFTGIINDEQTGINIYITNNTITWTCPAGYAIPKIIIRNIPSYKRNIEVICDKAEGCYVLYLWFYWDSLLEKWSLHSSKKILDYGLSKFIFNRNTDKDGLLPSVLCVLNEDKNNWFIANNP